MHKKVINEKINLIYILGTGFCGSTLLSLILGAQKGVLNLGEVWALEEDYYRNRLCTCGKNVRQCSYWQSIIKFYDTTIKHEKIDDFFDFNNPKEKAGLIFSKINYKHRLLHNLTCNPYYIFSKRNIIKYINKNYFFFLSNLDYYNDRNIYILDASKSLDRLMILNSSNLFNILLIFISRNGMSLIDSFMRRHSHKIYDKIGVTSCTKTIRWEFEIVRYLRLMEKFPRDKLYILSYEDFTTNTVTVIEELCEFLNIPYNPKTLFQTSSHYFSNSEQHVFTGNELIAKFRNIGEIKPTDLWKLNLTRWDKFLFRICGGDIMNNRLNRLGNKKSAII